MTECIQSRNRRYFPAIYLIILIIVRSGQLQSDIKTDFAVGEEGIREFRFSAGRKPFIILPIPPSWDE